MACTLGGVPLTFVVVRQRMRRGRRNEEARVSGRKRSNSV